MSDIVSRQLNLTTKILRPNFSVGNRVLQFKATPISTHSTTTINTGLVVTLKKTAGETISALQPVYLINDLAYIAKSGNESAIDAVAGIALTATMAGAEVTIIPFGEMEDSFWHWESNLPIFINAAGGLTQTAPTTGFSCIVATPLSATKILVNIKQGINLI